MFSFPLGPVPAFGAEDTAPNAATMGKPGVADMADRFHAILARLPAEGRNAADTATGQGQAANTGATGDEELEDAPEAVELNEELERLLSNARPETGESEDRAEPESRPALTRVRQGDFPPGGPTPMEQPVSSPADRANATAIGHPGTVVIARPDDTPAGSARRDAQSGLRLVERPSSAGSTPGPAMPLPGSIGLPGSSPLRQGELPANAPLDPSKETQGQASAVDRALPGEAALSGGPDWPGSGRTGEAPEPRPIHGEKVRDALPGESGRIAARVSPDPDAGRGTTTVLGESVQHGGLDRAKAGRTGEAPEPRPIHGEKVRGASPGEKGHIAARVSPDPDAGRGTTTVLGESVQHGGLDRAKAGRTGEAPEPRPIHGEKDHGAFPGLSGRFAARVSSDPQARRGLTSSPMADPSAPGVAVGDGAGRTVMPAGRMPPAEVAPAAQDSLMSGAVPSPAMQPGRPEPHHPGRFSHATSNAFESTREEAPGQVRRDAGAAAQGVPARPFGNGGGGAHVGADRPAANALLAKPPVVPATERPGIVPADSGADADLRAAVDSGPSARPVQPAASGPPHAAHIPRGPVQQIAAAVQGGAERSFDITLSPAELGKVRITLTPGDAGLSVSILADRPETLDLLRRHVDQLAQDFREIGYDQAAFSFGSGGKDGAPGGEQAHPPPDRAPAAARDGDGHRTGESPLAAQVRRAPAGDSRMDIRI